MPSLKMILQGVCSMPAMAAISMTLMGLGAIDVDEGLGAVAKVYTDAVGLPLKPFLVFVGVSKLSAVLTFWFNKPLPSRKLAFLGLATPATCAAIGHYQVEGPAGAIPPTVFLCILGAFYVVDQKEEDGTKSTKSQ